MTHLLGRVPFLPPKPKNQGRGLKNTGNTCFLNSVLQSLTSVKSFHIYLANETNKPTRQALHETLQELSFNTTQTYIPTKLSSIPSLKTNFLNNEQHDAHEFLHFLFSSLEEEENTHAPENHVPQTHVQTHVPQIFGPSIVQAPKNGNPFSGLLASNILCSNCGTKENYFLNKFSSLSLSPPPGLTPLKKSSSPSPPKKGMVFCTLEECLEQFTSEDVLQAVECHVCSSMEIIKAQSLGAPINLEATAPFLKQKLFVGHPPPALCFHIRRLLGNMKQSYKVGVHVRFSMLLNMTPFCLPHHIWGDNESIIRKEDAEEAEVESEKEEEEGEEDDDFKAWMNGPKNYVGGSDPHLKTFISTSPPSFLHVPDSFKQKNQHSSPEIITNSPSSTTPISIPCTSNSHLAHKTSHKESPPPSEILYKLMAVIVHHGSDSGGHFTTYRRLLNGLNNINNRDDYLNFIRFHSLSSPKAKNELNALGCAGDDVWVHLSDENCRVVQDVEEVLNCQAYMLFYEKI